MKVTYTADDGTEFDSANACLAWEAQCEEQCEKWEQLVYQERRSELLEFLGKISRSWSEEPPTRREPFSRLFTSEPEIEFCCLSDFWPYRQRFVELARTFIEIDPTLKH